MAGLVTRMLGSHRQGREDDGLKQVVPVDAQAPVDRLEVPKAWQNKIESGRDVVIHKVPHPRIHPGKVKAGDLCFTYKWKSTHPMHSAIKFVQMLHKRSMTPLASCVGSKNVTHTSIVVGVDDLEQSIDIAEASGCKGMTCVTTLRFGEPARQGSNIDDGSCYLFYRLADAQVAAEIASLAQHWASKPGQAYPLRRAQLLWTRAPWMGPLGPGRVDKVLKHAESGEEGTPHNMYCSEFVVSVGAAATVEVAARTKPNLLRSSQSLRRESPGLFYRDPSCAWPIHLHGAVLRAKEVETVGCIVPDKASAVETMQQLASENSDAVSILGSNAQGLMPPLPVIPSRAPTLRCR